MIRLKIKWESTLYFHGKIYHRVSNIWFSNWRVSMRIHHGSSNYKHDGFLSHGCTLLNLLSLDSFQRFLHQIQAPNFSKIIYSMYIIYIYLYRIFYEFSRVGFPKHTSSWASNPTSVQVGPLSHAPARAWRSQLPTESPEQREQRDPAVRLGRGTWILQKCGILIGKSWYK